MGYNVEEFWKKFYHLLSSLGQYKTNKAKKSSNIALPILEAIVVCLSNVIFDVKNEMFDIFLLVLLSISLSAAQLFGKFLNELRTAICRFHIAFLSP